MDFAMHGPYAHYFNLASETVTRVAWILVASWLLWNARWIARRVRAAARESALLFGLFVSALALRLWLPWGPVNFGEAERLDVLWSPVPNVCTTMCTVPVAAQLAQRVGASVTAILRVGAPLFGALGVVGAYLFARAAGLRVGSAAVAAVVVLGWPAHLHYSTSMTFSVEGVAVWCFAFAVALPRTGEVPLRAGLLSALTTLGVYSRPELRLLLIPMAVAVLGAPWTRRERALYAAMLGVAMISYVQHLMPGGSTGESGSGRAFAALLLRDPSISPVWWFYLGGAGLIAGLATRGRRAVSVSLALTIALLSSVYFKLASDPNPRWGQWRYFTSLVPFIAVAVAILADRLGGEGRTLRRRGVLAGLIALAGLTPLASLRELRRAEDQAAEFAYIRETAPRVLASRTDVLLLSNGGHEGLSDVRIEMLPRMAMATRVGALALPSGCDGGAPGSHRLRDLEVVMQQCPETLSAERSVVYLGLSRIEARIEPILDRYELVPIEERWVKVVVSSRMINRQPSAARPMTQEVIGLGDSDVRVRLGWYRLVPRHGA